MLNADEIEVFKAFFPHGISICNKHKRITISKKLSRILIIVMIMIIMMIIIMMMMIMMMMIMMMMIRSNNNSIDETLTWGHRFDDKLERSAVYYFKGELSVAILAIDSI